MPSLLEQQREFAAALLAPRAASARMAVYRANVHGSWRGALGGAYPVVRRIVGEAYFEALARDYARAFPSLSGDLHEYGAQLAAFLAGAADAQDLPYLPDVARLEWLAHRAHYAADAAPFDVSRPTEARLAPACALLESDWPLARIWEAHQDGGEPASVDLGAGPERVLVHRDGWRVRVRALRRGDYCFLERLGAGLGAALEAALAADGAFDPRAALAFWVNQGVITQ
jgi:uncharacterized protein